MHETITFLLVTFCQIFTDLIFFTPTLSNKLVLIWLLTTRPHLKYAAKLPCNLSLMACFADINVSQGSVATYAKCGWIFIGPIHLTANLPRNLPVKKIVNRLKFDRIMVMSLWPGFWPTLYIDRGPHTSQPINQLFLRKKLPYYMHSVLSIPDDDPLIQCQLTEL